MNVDDLPPLPDRLSPEFVGMCNEAWQHVLSIGTPTFTFEQLQRKAAHQLRDRVIEAAGYRVAFVTGEILDAPILARSSERRH